MKFEPVIGLEIHAQLATNTKMFSRVTNEHLTSQNSKTSQVCLGLPGTLPTVNKKAVEFAIMLGLATHCQIRRDSQFARKHYFYPDLPKAYQISQFDKPICEHGHVEIEVDGKTKRIGITRIHMEEDAGKLVHDGADPACSYVDLNRAGTPLLEIVSEPDLKTPLEAKLYMEKIYSIVTYLGICHGDMEKGNLRCDANISLRPVGQKEFGTRTETKNLNSFRFVQKAIEYEIARQTDVLLDGGTIHQETRLFDTSNNQTFAMRSKEDAHDYRYFPCPDLPTIKFPEQWVIDLEKTLPELPDEKIERFINQYKLSKYDASLLVNDKQTSFFFEKVAKNNHPKIVANWILGELLRLLNEEKISLQDSNITPENLSALLTLIEKKIISGKIAKSVFEDMFQTGQDPESIVQEKGLQQITDQSEIEKICADIVTNNPSQVQDFRNGKDRLFGFFVGQVMKQTQGKANPQVVNDILKNLLK